VEGKQLSLALNMHIRIPPYWEWDGGYICRWS